MTNEQPDLTPIERKSPDGKAERIAELKRLFPDLFDGEGQLDKAAFEAFFDDSPAEAERFRFEWAGKQDSKRLAFTESRATLVADTDKSQHFDTTQNVIIEGDNLEALKLLQATYFEQVKCIYIDPPYNTGKDFIYSDKFAEGTKPYWRKNGTIKDGVKLVDNPETAGRYHSNWLNMMQPRLILARQLLRDDGVIFISIDDHEVHHLRKLCDEIFGEENFVSKITWLKKRKGSFLSKKKVSITEYCLIYGKNNSLQLIGGKADKEESQPLIKRTNSVGILHFPAMSVKTKLSDGNYDEGIYGSGTSSAELLNKIIVKKGIIQNSFKIRAPFVWSQSYLDKQIEGGAQIIINTINLQVRAYKSLNEDSYKGFPTFVSGVDIKGTNEDGYEELEEILGSAAIMDYPKPINYIKNYLSAVYCSYNDIIMDFFAGSGTTAHAVMQQNAEDNGNRKYILVQIPEYTDEKSEAFKAGYKTISDICIERVKRAGAKIQSENPETNLDTGFRVYKLTDSHFPENIYGHDKNKTFDENRAALEAYMKANNAQQTLFTLDNQYNLITEISVKNGYGLFFTLEAQSETFAQNTVHRLSGNNRATLLCLDETIAQETVDTLIADHTDGQLIIRQDGLTTAQKWTLQRAFRDNLRVV